ncbi:MAG TPA: hypothetical protein DDW81_04280 [Cryomorphaceae bacterium]|nr:hypothetical protein [Owenweeksia sp.]HBF19290.1 hypothetical protein [Cryomorphaceae bacterium]HCQ17554.1 hypothetical protein [Cryomorphaceae bacterium]|tara:strand:+ start:4888 stop:6507 length:1620 start_codon:yes stop_codon:yes gene_type:complete
MKHLFSILAFCTMFGLAKGQTCDILYDYATPGNWTIVDLNSQGNVPGTPRILIQNGELEFDNAPDGENEIRAWQRLPNTLCNNWIVEFEFESLITREGTNQNRTVGHLPFAATAGSLAPTRDFDRNDTDQDFIGVAFVDGTNTNDFRFQIFLKDGTTRIFPVEDFEIDVNMTGRWTVRLERIDGEKVRMTVWDTETEELIGQVCVTIPENTDISNLTHVQSANNPIGFDQRVLDGLVDNICVRNCEKLDACCFNKDIEGPTQICETGGFALAPTYTIANDPAASYTWSISGLTSFNGQGTNSITVTNWGEGTSFVVQLIVECNCFIDTLEKIVTVHNISGVDGNFSQTWGDNGSDYTSISVSALQFGTGMSHEWNIYEGTVCDGNHGIANPTPLLSGNGANESWSNSGGFSNLPISGCYVIEHIITFGDSPCDPVVYYRQKASTESEGRTARSITGTTTSEGLSIYPNPAENKLTISLGSRKEAKAYRVYNSAGKLVTTGSENLERNFDLDIVDFASGVYTLQVIYTDDSRESSRFSKK